MVERRQPLLGDLFGGADLLDLAARRHLAVLLSVAGRPPPLLPGELPATPLPRDAEEVERLPRAIEDGLGKEALARLGGQRLGEIVPAVAGRNGPIITASWPPRLRSLLETNEATS